MRETIRTGSKGSDVLYLQQRLNACMNVGLSTDGDFGPKTDEALKNYQKKKNLAVDGICGAKTWAAIDADSGSVVSASAVKTASVGSLSAAKYAQKIICSNEGNYGTVVKDDNGALSIGELQWHAGRALSLLRSIADKNQAQAQKILGHDLYDEVTSSSTDWTKRIATDAEKKLITSLLSTTEGKNAQDELAVSDISTYVNKGIKYGLSDTSALIYFADGTNQYGINSDLWENIAAAALKNGGGLDAMYSATKEQTTKYLDRRDRVYKAVKALNIANA